MEAIRYNFSKIINITKNLRNLDWWKIPLRKRTSDHKNVVTKKENERMTEICKLQENVVNNSETKTICFTGKMDYKRSEMEKIAKERGYTPVDSVDKNLDVLVCADINSNSSKLQKARKYGVKILNVVDFLK
jgi:NAD-dependent DNA ligase